MQRTERLHLRTTLPHACLARRRCSLADADYAPIFEQLAPFRAAGGVTPALITKALDALDPQRYYAAIARLEVRNGTARVTKGNAADQNLGLLFGMLPGFVTELPDMDVVINLFDEPAVWTAPVPPEVDRAVRSRAVQVGDAFARHGCDGAPGPGGAVLAAARAQRLHATFARSTSMGPFARGLLPVFSWSTIPGCFGGAPLPGAALRCCCWTALLPWRRQATAAAAWHLCCCLQPAACVWLPAALVHAWLCLTLAPALWITPSPCRHSVSLQVGQRPC